MALLPSILSKYESIPKNGLINEIKNSNDLKAELISCTEFLDFSYSISARLFVYINDIHEKPTCICGKPLKFHKLDKGFYKTCGDKNCIKKILSIQSTQANKTKDWDKIIKKTARTNMQRYGAVSNLSKNTESRKYANKKLKEKYGVEHALQKNEIKEKQKQTTLQIHGTLNFVNSKKVKNTIKERYGVEHAMKNKDVAKRSGENSSNTKNGNLLKKIDEMNMSVLDIKEGFYTLKCNICETESSNVSRQIINVSYLRNESPCHKCNPTPHFRSNGEVEIVEEIKKFWDGEIQLNRQYLGAEVDIIIPDIKLCIEYNGVYWHSELYKPANFHINKKKLIESKGYHLIYVWEDDWNLKKDIVISRLKHQFGVNKKIGARQCILKEVSYKECCKFLEKNHLQGNSQSSIRLGLFYNDSLVSICTFSRNRNSIGKNTGYELTRNCTKMGYTIVGGFKRLITHFFNIRPNDNLYSYVDLDWSPLENSAYDKIGFTQDSITSPSYFWVINGVRSNRINHQKHKLVEMGFDKNKSESQIMYEDFKSYKVYNSGNLKYLWK